MKRLREELDPCTQRDSLLALLKTPLITSLIRSPSRGLFAVLTCSRTFTVHRRDLYSRELRANSKRDATSQGTRAISWTGRCSCDTFLRRGNFSPTTLAVITLADWNRKKYRLSWKTRKETIDSESIRDRSLVISAHFNSLARRLS